MKRYCIAVLLSVTCSAASAEYFDSRTQVAKVTHVEPIYEQISVRIPEEHCWNETVAIERRRSATGPILGAIIGGALGNELGHKKSNKRVGAVVGAALGASLGNDIARQRGHNQRHYETVQRCESRDRFEQRQELIGYDVEYRYHGEIYHTRMPYNPGREMEIEVQVRPLG